MNAGRAIEVAASLLLVAGGSLWMLAAFLTAALSLHEGVVPALLLLFCGGPGLSFAVIGLAGLASLKKPA